MSNKTKETIQHQESDREQRFADESQQETQAAHPGDGKTSSDSVQNTTSTEEDLQTQFYRMAADFQNYKRRVGKEKNDIYAYANEKIMSELLSVLDNFERALGVDSVDKALQGGMNMVFKQLFGVLEAAGLKEIEAQGQLFDPNYHHAVVMTPGEGVESGQVLEVLQKGYQLNSKVIRPAMVKVAE